MSDAIEELEDLDGALAAQTDSIAVLRGLDGAVVPGQGRHYGR
jgi:hypothetical protein